MIDAFLLKKFVSVFVHIIPGVPIILLFSLLLRRWLPRFSVFLSLFLCAILLAGSFPFLTKNIVLRLESQFPVLQQVPDDTGLILVLGYGHVIADANASDRPINTLLYPVALSRLTEGVRLWRAANRSEMAEVKLAVSGAAPVPGTTSHAEMMSRMALELDVPKSSIVRFDNTLDTEFEIKTAKDWLAANNMADRRLIVVSTAMHLPRAAMLLDKHDVKYTMAPTEFTISDTGWNIPSAGTLYTLDRALHEYVGMAWYRIKAVL